MRLSPANQCNRPSRFYSSIILQHHRANGQRHAHVLTPRRKWHDLVYKIANPGRRLQRRRGQTWGPVGARQEYYEMSAIPLENAVTWDRTRSARGAALRSVRVAIRAIPRPSAGGLCAGQYVYPAARLEQRSFLLLLPSAMPKPCPLIGAFGGGRSATADAGRRPRYSHRYSAVSRLRDGEFLRRSATSEGESEDLVTFALGCSFSFEEAMLEAGLRLKFLERNSVAGV